VLRNPGNLFGDLLRRENEIDVTGRNRTSRHTVVLGGFVLGEGYSIRALDRLQSHRAVSGRAGKNYADRLVALVGRERFKEVINLAMLAVSSVARTQLEDPVLDRHAPIRGNHIYVIGLNGRIVDDLEDGQCCGSTEQLGKLAFMLGIEVLDKDEAHSCVIRKMLNEPSECLQPAC
jgi:hypothetical protein